jgi:hypothetical protein
MVYDADRHGLWVHGGFGTYFPYISTNGAGSGGGVQVTRMRHIQ